MTGFWKTLLMGFFVKIEFDKLYPRANPPASLRLIAPFAFEIACFVYDHAYLLVKVSMYSNIAI